MAAIILQGCQQTEQSADGAAIQSATEMATDMGFKVAGGAGRKLSDGRWIVYVEDENFEVQSFEVRQRENGTWFSQVRKVKSSDLNTMLGSSNVEKINDRSQGE